MKEKENRFLAVDAQTAGEVAYVAVIICPVLSASRIESEVSVCRPSSWSAVDEAGELW